MHFSEAGVQQTALGSFVYHRQTELVQVGITVLYTFQQHICDVGLAELCPGLDFCKVYTEVNNAWGPEEGGSSRTMFPNPLAFRWAPLLGRTGERHALKTINSCFSKC